MAVPGQSFRKANLKIFCNVIFRIAGETPARLTLASIGSLTIDVLLEATVTRLVKPTSLGGVKIEAQLQPAYWETTVLIRGIHTPCTDGTPPACLGEQGVIKTCYRWRKRDSGALKVTDKIYIYFRDNTDRPVYLKTRFWKAKVKSAPSHLRGVFDDRNIDILENTASPQSIVALCMALNMTGGLLLKHLLGDM